MERRTLTLSQLEVAEESLGFFRWGQVADRVLVTNDAGDWAFLSQADFDDLLAGRVTDGHPRFPEFQQKGFLRDGLDLDALAARVGQHNRHLHRGPSVHVVTLTLRDSRSNGAAGDTDMTPETAEQVVDLALRSTSPSVTFELQGHGGEPLLNFAALRHLVETAQLRNKSVAGKTLGFRLLSNLTGMTEEAAEWLIANDVVLSTTFDGPAAVHDWNRQWKPGSSHADVVRWIDYFDRRYRELGRDPQRWHVNTLLTTTRRTLEAAPDVVSEYVTRGLRTIHFRPLDRWRFDAETWAAIGYTLDEYIAFYRRALDAVVQTNRRGASLMESTAAIFLMKILSNEDPGIVDIQSPSGAGTAQLAYTVDGRVFPSDDARIVDMTGDAIFALGHARELSGSHLLRHPTIRAIASASLLDAQPMCADCWNKPFCGFSPVRNFITQGDLFGQRPHCLECKEHMAVSRRLFELLANESDVDTIEILKRWSVTRSPVVSARATTPAP